MDKTQVIVADTQPILADSLSFSLNRYVDFVSHPCHSYADVPPRIAQSNPQIVVINVHQDVAIEALDLCRSIAGIPQQLTIVLLVPRSLVERETFTADAVEHGADGVLIKEEINLQQLVEALKEVREGRSIIDARRLRDALAARRSHPSTTTELEKETLTTREQEVANLIAEGRTTTDIASALCISERTVQSHISSILSKLGVRTRAEAVVRIYRWRQSQSG